MHLFENLGIDSNMTMTTTINVQASVKLNFFNLCSRSITFPSLHKSMHDSLPHVIYLGVRLWSREGWLSAMAKQAGCKLPATLTPVEVEVVCWSSACFSNH